MSSLVPLPAEDVMFKFVNLRGIVAGVPLMRYAQRRWFERPSNRRALPIG